MKHHRIQKIKARFSVLFSRFAVLSRAGLISVTNHSLLGQVFLEQHNTKFWLLFQVVLFYSSFELCTFCFDMRSSKRYTTMAAFAADASSQNASGIEKLAC